MEYKKIKKEGIELAKKLLEKKKIYYVGSSFREQDGWHQLHFYDLSEYLIDNYDGSPYMALTEKGLEYAKILVESENDS